MPLGETAIVLATVIAAVSAIAAVIGAVVASRSALGAMKSAYAVMMAAQKKYGGMLPPPITITVNKKIDWVRNFSGLVDRPFGTVLTILFSIAIGVGLNLFLSQSAPLGALVPASKPAALASTTPVSAPPPPIPTATVPASTTLVSAPPPSTPTATVPASTTPVSASPPPTSNATAPDRSEIADLLARARASLSNGDVALARVFLRRAAERDDPDAALVLGATYDSAELRNLGIPNFQAHADLSKAREWYRKAADLGSAGAALRLERLP